MRWRSPWTTWACVNAVALGRRRSATYAGCSVQACVWECVEQLVVGGMSAPEGMRQTGVWAHCGRDAQKMGAAAVFRRVGARWHPVALRATRGSAHVVVSNSIAPRSWQDFCKAAVALFTIAKSAHRAPCGCQHHVNARCGRSLATKAHAIARSPRVDYGSRSLALALRVEPKRSTRALALR